VTLPNNAVEATKPVSRKPRLVHHAGKSQDVLQQQIQQRQQEPAVVPLTTMDRSRQVQLLVFAPPPSSTPLASDAQQLLQQTQNEPAIDGEPSAFTPALVVAACSGGWIRILDADAGTLLTEFQPFPPPPLQDGDQETAAPPPPTTSPAATTTAESFVGLYAGAGGALVVCTSRGRVAVRRVAELAGAGGAAAAEAGSDTAEDDGGDASDAAGHMRRRRRLPPGEADCELGVDGLRRMRVFPGSPALFATGGQERDLCLWRLCRGVGGVYEAKAIWTAKNVKNDYLDLRVPVCINDIGFVAPDSTAPSKIVVVSQHRHFRVYDVNGGARRPVLSVEIGTNPLKSLTLVNGETEAIVADNKGGLLQLDVATGRSLGTYRGIAGTVAAVADLPGTRHVAVAGLDRFVRIFEKSGKHRIVRSVTAALALLAYDINSTFKLTNHAPGPPKTLYIKIYLKQRMTALLADARFDPALPASAALGRRTPAEAEPEKRRRRRRRGNDDDEDDDDGEDEDEDAIWSRMREVGGGAEPDNEEAPAARGSSKRMKAGAVAKRTDAEGGRRRKTEGSKVVAAP
ncbi:WD repeat-containing protein 74, partial [Cladochytrium tenue]